MSINKGETYYIEIYKHHETGLFNLRIYDNSKEWINSVENSDSLKVILDMVPQILGEK